MLQQTNFLDSLFGRTSQEPSAATKETTSEPSSRRSAKRQDGGGIIYKPKKWEHSGTIVGEGFSIAWRLYDAQFWGVPQRRKRIYLIADFRSERAGEILFESESMPGHPEPGGAPWKAFAGNVTGSPERGFNACGFCGKAAAAAGSIGYRGGYHQPLKQDRKHTSSTAFRETESTEQTPPDVMEKDGARGGVCYTLNTIDRPAIVCLNDQGGR